MPGPPWGPSKSSILRKIFDFQWFCQNHRFHQFWWNPQFFDWRIERKASLFYKWGHSGPICPFSSKMGKTTFFGFSTKIPIFYENGEKLRFSDFLRKSPFSPKMAKNTVFWWFWPKSWYFTHWVKYRKSSIFSDFFLKITDFINFDEILNSSIEELREKHRFSTNGPFLAHLSIFFENGKNYVFRIFYENPHFLWKWQKTQFFDDFGQNHDISPNGWNVENLRFSVIFKKNHWFHQNWWNPQFFDWRIERKASLFYKWGHSGPICLIFIENEVLVEDVF